MIWCDFIQVWLGRSGLILVWFGVVWCGLVWFGDWTDPPRPRRRWFELLHFMLIFSIRGPADLREVLADDNGRAGLEPGQGGGVPDAIAGT